MVHSLGWGYEGPWGLSSSLLVSSHLYPSSFFSHIPHIPLTKSNSFSCHTALGSFPPVPPGCVPEQPQPLQLLVPQVVSDWDHPLKCPRHPKPACGCGCYWAPLGFSAGSSGSNRADGCARGASLSGDRAAPLRRGVHIPALSGPAMHIRSGRKFLRRCIRRSS